MIVVSTTPTATVSRKSRFCGVIDGISPFLSSSRFQLL
jgi:hypothetical protein